MLNYTHPGGEVMTTVLMVPEVLPVANFSGSPLSNTAPLTVTFTDTSTNSPTSWTWSFGDGNTSTEQNPSHTYSTAGMHDVSLNVTNAAGWHAENYTHPGSEATTTVLMEAVKTGTEALEILCRL